MNKIPALRLFVMMSLLSGGIAADDVPIAVTAEQIARHLGISSWRIPPSSLPGKYSIAVRKIKEGRLSDYVGNQFTIDVAEERESFADQSYGLIVCTHLEGEDVIITADTGLSILRFRGRFGHEVRIGHIPQKVVLGVYPLFAVYKKGSSDTGKIEDILDGAALILEKK